MPGVTAVKDSVPLQNAANAGVQPFRELRKVHSVAQVARQDLPAVAIQPAAGGIAPEGRQIRPKRALNIRLRPSRRFMNSITVEMESPTAILTRRGTL